MREDFAPGDIVIPDQLIDFTRNRKQTFFEKGLVAHISPADPFCINLSNDVFRALQTTNANIHIGGTFVTIEGPRFSTKAAAFIFSDHGAFQ